MNDDLTINDLTIDNNLTDDARLHYQVLVDDIRESKANQWRISNYGLLAQAAVATVISSVNTNHLSREFNWLHAFPVISLCICIAAIYFVYEAWCRIKRCRQELDVYPRPYNKHNRGSHSDRDVPILIMFVCAQFIGTVMSVIYVGY